VGIYFINFKHGQGGKEKGIYKEGEWKFFNIRGNAYKIGFMKDLEIVGKKSSTFKTVDL